MNLFPLPWRKGGWQTVDHAFFRFYYDRSRLISPVFNSRLIVFRFISLKVLIGRVLCKANIRTSLWSQYRFEDIIFIPIPFVSTLSLNAAEKSSNKELKNYLRQLVIKLRENGVQICAIVVWALRNKEEQIESLSTVICGTPTCKLPRIFLFVMVVKLCCNGRPPIFL